MRPVTQTEGVVDETVIVFSPFWGVSTNVYRLVPAAGVAARFPVVGPFALYMTISIAGFSAAGGPFRPAVGGVGALHATWLRSPEVLLLHSFAFL